MTGKQVGDLIDAKLKTLSDTQTAKVNALVDTKLKALNDSQTTKINDLILKNDTQTAKLSEMIGTKPNTLSDPQTERLNELIASRKTFAEPPCSPSTSRDDRAAGGLTISRSTGRPFGVSILFSGIVSF